VATWVEGGAGALEHLLKSEHASAEFEYATKALEVKLDSHLTGLTCRGCWWDFMTETCDSRGAVPQISKGSDFIETVLEAL